MRHRLGGTNLRTCGDRTGGEAMTANDDALTVSVNPDGVIVVNGDIDMAGGPVVEAAILEHENGAPVRLDLGGVTFIDSSGLRSLLAASRRAHERNTNVVLQSVGPEVARLLEITGTEGQFVVESRRD
jgi:anti-sigma B factor antagonist